MNTLKRILCGKGQQSSNISENNLRVEWLEGMTLKITFTDNVYMDAGDTLSVVCPMNIEVIPSVVYPEIAREGES